MFPRLPPRATFVADTKNVSDFVQKHFVSATNVSQFAQPKKHHEQQCVLVCRGLIKQRQEIKKRSYISIRLGLPSTLIRQKMELFENTLQTGEICKHQPIASV